MKLNVKHLCVLCLALVAGPVFGTAFSNPSYLINTPTVKPMTKGDYSFGTNLGFFDSKKNEFDFSGDYALTNQVRIGATLIRPSQFAGHVHWQFINGKRFGVAAGVLNITDSDNLSSWEGFPMTQDTSFSQYLVGRYNFKKLSLNLGYGTKQFVMGDPGVKRSGSVNGVFWGVEIPLNHVRLVYEFDGKDYNAAAFVALSKTTEFHVGLTELFLDKKTNANYNDSPVRLVTFGFTFFGNRFQKDAAEQDMVLQREKNIDMLMADMKKTNEMMQAEAELYRKSRLEMEDNLKRVQIAMKTDTRYLMEQDQKKKDEMRQHYLGVNQEIGEKVISLYYDSFDMYYKKEYYKAIEALQKAVILDPYMPQLYTRLGSIYFELGMKKEATDSWKKAYSLDPDNEELNSFLNPGQDSKTK